MIYLLMFGCNNGMISGVVSDWSTNNGISGADVTLYQGEEPVSVTTDDRGAFFFPELANTQGLILAQAAGYRSEEVQVGFGGFAMEDEDGRHGKDNEDFSITTIKLLPTSQSVEGTVTLNAEGFENAFISVSCNEELLASVYTDASGFYSAPDLSLCVSAASSETVDGVTQEYPSEIISYHVMVQLDTDGDGVHDKSETKAVNVAVGQAATSNFDFEVPVEEPDPTPETRTLSGVVLVNGYTPAANALVYLHEEPHPNEDETGVNDDFGTGDPDLTDETDSIVFAETYTDENGRFEFTINKDLGRTYKLYGMPHDIDGDGWVDTGIAEETVAWEQILDNHVLQLPQTADRNNPKGNCELGSTTTYTLAADEPVYYLFESSVRQDMFAYTLLGPDNQVIPSTATWIGNYMVQVSPDAPLNSVNPNDIYTMKITSLVYTDGYVAIDPTLDDTESRGSDSCSFRVGELPTITLEDPTPELFTDSTFDSTVEYQLNEDENGYDTHSLANVEISWTHVDGASSYRVYGMQSNISPDSVSGNGVTGQSVNEWMLLDTVSASAQLNSQIHSTIDLRNFDGGLGEELGLSNQISIIVKSVDANGYEAEITGSETALTLSDETAAYIEDLRHSGIENDLQTGETELTDPRFGFSELMDVNALPDFSEVSKLGGRISSIAFGSDAYWESDETPENEVYDAYSDSLTITYNDRSNHTIQGNVSVADPYMWNIASGNLGTPLEGWAHNDVVGVYRPINDPNVDTDLNVHYLTIDGISTSDNAIAIDPDVGGANTGDTSGADDAFSNEWSALVNYCVDLTLSCEVAQQQFDSYNHCWYYFTGYDQPEENPSDSVDGDGNFVAGTPCNDLDVLECNHPVARGLWSWIDYAGLQTVQSPTLSPEQHPHDVRIGSFGDQIFDTLECRNSKLRELEVVPDEYQTATGAAIFPDPDNPGSFVKADGSAYEGDGILGDDLFTVYTNADVYCPQAAGDSAVCKNDLRANDVIFDPCNSRTTITVEAADGTDTIVVADASKFFVGQDIEIGAETGELYHTVDAVNAATNTITLDSALVGTQEVGSVVVDLFCDFGLRNAVVSTLNNGNDMLISSTSIDAVATTFTFENAVSLSEVVVGDIVLVEDENGNRAMATISSLRTIDASFSDLTATEVDPDEDADQTQIVKEVVVGAFQPLGLTTLPFTIDPSTATVKVLGDALQYQATTVQDTSGNTGLNPDMDTIFVLDANGNGNPLSDY